jgi:hypothetical protein
VGVKAVTSGHGIDEPNREENAGFWAIELRKTKAEIQY